MKWFRHQSDAYTDFALREIIAEFDGYGYAIYWHCLELVAQQGKNCRLKAPTKWQKQLVLTLKVSQGKVDKVLKKLATLNLINERALNRGDLYIPKMRTYSDEYTKRVRRVFGHYPNSVPLQHVQHVHNNTKKTEGISSSSKKKPFYKEEEMRFYHNRWWVIPKDGSKWLEFNGKDSEIEWKIIK